jgi:benzoate transport
MNPNIDVRMLLHQRPMARAQIAVVALCVVINMMDGFEILAPALTAAQISRQWMLGPAQLGRLFSSGLAGMALGALALSPLADFWGRRRTVLLCLVIITTGMLWSAATPSLWHLMTARAVTGIGVGAMLAANNTIVAEYANDRWRDLAICLQAAGFPLGGALGGLVAYMISDVGWRWVFVVGGAFSTLLIAAVVAWLPESFDFLIERRPRRALERVNLLLCRLGMPKIDVLPDPALRNYEYRPTGAVRGGVWLNTLLICSSCFLLMFTFYFLTNWMPKLLTDYGVSLKVGASGAAFMNLGGVIGDLLFAALTIRWPAHRLGPVFMSACFGTVVLFALLPTRPETLTPMVFLLGFLLFGSMTSLYAIVPMIYTATVRTSGTGLTLGLGRIGAAAGPYVGGLLIAMAWNRTAYLVVMAFPLLLCAAGTLLLSKRSVRPPPNSARTLL